ncbi:MAG: hypothetical protein ABIF82_07935 [Planctomycetota bacterium]
MGLGEMGGAALLENITIGELFELARERVKEETGLPTEPGPVFRKQGENWMLHYDGKTVYAKARIGLEYIAHVLANPGKTTSVMSLQNAAAVASPSGGQMLVSWNLDGSGGPAGGGSYGLRSEELVTDAAALKECKERLRDLEEEIEQAEAENNEGLVCGLKEERAKLVQYVQAGAGLRGRLRKVADSREKARKAVSNAISRAISVIFKHHDVLGRHLRNAIRTGNEVVYDPETPVDWDV